MPRDDRTEPPALEPPEIVASEPALRALVERLHREPEIAVDTEADSFYHYQESVCLIQVTAGARDFLIDPLAGIDLAPLGRVLADPARIKVFHDGEYDVLLLKRQFGFSFANLFDTRVAAAALGAEMPGLASVLAAHFGVELDKSLQRSDWSARPLTSKQIEYARLDTHYLLALMHAQRAQLEERERAVVVAGECQRLENLAAPARAFDPDEFVRLKGARALSLQRMQVLRELFVLRDDLARRRDVPPFKVLGNNLLIEIARRSPRSQRELERVDGMPLKIARRIGNELVGAVARATELGPLPSIPRLPARDGTGGFDDDQLELFERFKEWRKVKAQELEMDSSLVLNRHTLLKLATTRATNLRELVAIDGLLDWQVEWFGKELLAVQRAFEADLAAGRVERPRGRGRRV